MKTLRIKPGVELAFVEVSDKIVQCQIEKKFGGKYLEGWTINMVRKDSVVGAFFGSADPIPCSLELPVNGAWEAIGLKRELDEGMIKFLDLVRIFEDGYLMWGNLGSVSV